jgi:16S rRNA (cytosine967-C5)-methyltransferase
VSRPRVDHTRFVAYDLLRLVSDRGAYANLALPNLLRERGLGGRDAAFATELAFGTLRLRGRYDAMISASSRRPLDDIDARLLDVLRLGAHQVHGMRVPDYAAVSATVDMSRQIAGAGAAGFVNAIMRKITARSLDSWIADMPLPAAQSHPEWIIDAFTDALAQQGLADTLPDLLEADNRAAEVTLVARPGRITQDRLLAATGGSPGRWSPWAVRVPGDPGGWAEVRTGAAGVQDEGSQLVALAFSRAEVSGSDSAWLDMCAGPGGKTALLAGLADAAGASLTALEQHPHRAELVRRTLSGGSVDVDVRVQDATRLDEPSVYSRVLVDAPCTGLGAVRRRPELRWRRTPDDLPPLRAMQQALLDAAMRFVTVGGVVAYVTCSPHLSETDAMVAGALRRNTGFEQVDARPLLAGVPDLGPGPAVRLWPHLHDTDGMYLAVLKRSS